MKVWIVLSRFGGTTEHDGEYVEVAKVGKVKLLAIALLLPLLAMRTAPQQFTPVPLTAHYRITAGNSLTLVECRGNATACRLVNRASLCDVERAWWALHPDRAMALPIRVTYRRMKVVRCGLKDGATLDDVAQAWSR